MSSGRQKTPANAAPPAHVQFIERYLAQAPSGQVTGLFVLQVDKFNRIATSFGNDRTYSFCAHYAELLREFLPEKTPVIRLLERRFIVLVTRRSIADVVTVGRTIVEVVQPRLAMGRDKFSIDVNLGISVYPHHASDALSLVRRAELALRNAKDSELAFDIYELDASVQQKALWKFESELKQAIVDNKFEVHYQPKYDLEKDRVCGAEALVRWRNEAGQLMPAGQFVQAAERSGSIVPLTWVVFDQVAAAAEYWRFVTKPFSISVNTPPQALGSRDFFPRLEKLKQALAAVKVELAVELTEDGLMQTDAASIETLNKIRELGVGLAIDDFGKGYSSLNYIRQIPATELKIDGQFVSSIAFDSKDRHIVKTALELAEAFGMHAVAEGVDSEESLQSLVELGCEIAQGFFISRPMSADLLAEWLRARPFQHFRRALEPKKGKRRRAAL